MSTWYAPLSQIPSLGQQALPARRLADLHTRRAFHQGQFFTPADVARLAWTLGTRAFASDSSLSVLDNSCGLGALFQYADPTRHSLYGLDIHADSTDRLRSALDAAGFRSEILCCGMETVRARSFDLAILNPAFSVHLESPLLEPYPCTTFGRFGPNTSALSHAYALHQAVEAAQVTVAILPRTYAQSLPADPDLSRTLRAIFHLPAQAFASEGANVKTSLAVFGPHRGGGSRDPIIQTLADLSPDTLPNLPWSGLRSGGNGRLLPRVLGAFSDGITLPVTGDATVRVVRQGRRLALRFACGFVQSKVMNALLKERIDGHYDQHRYPSGVHFSGQGRLDLEVHLMQPDAMGSYHALLADLRAWGGNVQACPQIEPYLRKRVRRHAVAMTPLQHTIFVEKGASTGRDLPPVFEGVAKKAKVLDPDRWGSPRIKPGEAATFSTLDSGQYELRVKGCVCVLSRAELDDLFDVASAAAPESGWQQKFAGRAAAFPEKAAWLRARAKSLGLDQWLWAYQLDDVIESAMTRGGVALAWAMGLGKARATAALHLIGGGRHNLTAVEANLAGDMLAEYRALGIHDVQIIEKPADLQNLCRINIISYTRLRMPIDPARPRFTYAKALRRRIHTLTADEGHLLSNDTSQQSRALYAICPRRRYLLSGTPLPNRARNLFPMALWLLPQGTGVQPFGQQAPFMEARMIASMKYAERGASVFEEAFVKTVWRTWEFQDSLHGACYELPALDSLDRYRDWISRFILRRVWNEPAVSAHVRIPAHREVTQRVTFDEDHLARYLEVADEFRAWWVHYRETLGEGGKGLNLVAVLAHINAVFQMAQAPQFAKTNAAPYAGRTSKQRAAFNLLLKNARAGRKTLLFARSPDLLALLHGDLSRAGIDAVLYTGKVGRVKRNRDLAERFQQGHASVALMTYGVGATGLNLWQADEAVLFNPEWAPRVINQAICRLLRPQQTSAVTVTSLVLEGSLDDYMVEMVDLKSACADQALDWAQPDPNLDPESFSHWLRRLNEFSERLADLRGVKKGDLREALAC